MDLLLANRYWHMSSGAVTYEKITYKCGKLNEAGDDIDYQELVYEINESGGFQDKVVEIKRNGEPIELLSRQPKESILKSLIDEFDVLYVTSIEFSSNVVKNDLSYKVKDNISHKIDPYFHALGRKCIFCDEKITKENNNGDHACSNCAEKILDGTIEYYENILE